MRRKQSLLQTVQYATKTTTKNAIGEIVETWGSKTNLSVHMSPVSDRLSVEMYGERVTAMKSLIFDTGSIERGDGVWLTGETGTEPVWRVVSLENWPMHSKATIERVR